MPAPITSTTQDHLSVNDIQENLIILKDGSAAMAIETTAVNFGLLSEKEQDAIIYAYAALLNSLNFQIQILIRSERKDISIYLERLSDAAKKQISPAKKIWINSYRDFIAQTCERRNVLDKKFYLILPFFALELGSLKSLAPSGNKLPLPIADIIKKANTSLIPKRDHLIKQLERIGLTSHVLANQELLSLLYRVNNPGAPIPAIQPEYFTSPMIEPVISNNPSAAKSEI